MFHYWWLFFTQCVNRTYIYAKIKYEMQAHSSEHTIQVHVHDFFHFLLRFLTANMQKKSWTVYLNENIVRNVYCINHLLNSFTFWLHTIWLESICFWIETIFFILVKMCDDRWKTLLFQKEFVEFFLVKETLMEISHSEKKLHRSGEFFASVSF